MTGMVFREREQLADKIRRALPGVGVEVVRVPEGGPTLLYRPSRDRARTDVAPPRCLPDPSRISGWRCAPHLAGQVHGHAWRVKEATGAFTPVCVWCLHPAADLVSCACACHDSADEQAAESILRTVEQAKVAAARGAHLHPTDSSTLTQSELGHGVTSRSTFAQSVLGHLTGMPTVEVPERVDELPPLDDDAHDQAADQ